MDLQHIFPDEGDVQGALKTQLPQLLALAVGVEAPMTKKKPNCKWIGNKGGLLDSALLGVPHALSQMLPQLTYDPSLHHFRGQILAGHLQEAGRENQVAV